MAKRPMVHVSFRIPKKLRDVVEAMAEEREENISDVFRAALEDYVRSKR